MSGSISAYKVCELISLLVKNNHEVKVIATPSALNFIGKASLEGLTGHSVITSDFEDGQMMGHIDLGKWADAFIIAPATAQTINSLANGVGGGPLISTYLAYDMNKPLFIAPAMNTRMLSHPTTQKSLKALTSMGCDIMPCGEGSLACGEVGEGRLLEPLQIFNYILRKLRPVKFEKILITAGGTRVPIDSVRSITNTSTGTTGATLADYFLTQGYGVRLITSSEARRPEITDDVAVYDTYYDLENLLKNELENNNYHYIIHAAAVSDYTLNQVLVDGRPVDNTKKISSNSNVQLVMKPTEKIISQLKQWSSNKPKVIAFKLTNTDISSQRIAAISKLFQNDIDGVIHNDLSEITSSKHTFNLYKPDLSHSACNQKAELGPLIQSYFLNTEYFKPRELLMETIQ